MTQAQVESDLFRSYWDDGLLDLLSGLALLVAGVGWNTDLGALAAIQMPLWVTLWIPLRKQIVEPRAGYVVFAQSRRTRNTHKLAWSLALGLGLFVLLAAAAVVIGTPNDTGTANRLVSGLPGALVALAAVVANALTGARRFLGYALVLAVVATVAILLDLGPALPLALGGLVAASGGAVLLTRLVRESRAYDGGPQP